MIQLLNYVVTGVYADHYSVLHCSMLTSRGEVIHANYHHRTAGKLAEPLKDGKFGGSKNIFGWDDQFYVLGTGKTYHTHRLAGLKISARDMAISAFLKDHVYYKQLRNLQHTPLELSRPVDFDVDVADFVDREQYYNTQVAKEYGLTNMLNHVLNEGIFFKAADTRIVS